MTSTTQRPPRAASTVIGRLDTLLGRLDAMLGRITMYRLVLVVLAAIATLAAALGRLAVLRSDEWPWNVRVGENSPNL